MKRRKIMRTLSTRTWNPLNLFDSFDSLFTPCYEKFDFMKTDIIERENEYLLEVELPGYDKADLHLEFEDKYLTIKAERKVVTNDNEKVIRRERNVNTARSYYIGEIDEQGIKAKFENGVLSVTLPKIQPKKVEKLGIEIE